MRALWLGMRAGRRDGRLREAGVVACACFGAVAAAVLLDELDGLIAECAAAYAAPVSPQPH